MSSKYPTVLYLVREIDGDACYWVAYETAGEHARVDESIEIAVYRREHIASVKADSKIE